MSDKQINIRVLKQNTLRMAASLARGDGLSVLLGKCERQKTISTHVIENDLDVLQDFMKECAIQMKKLHDLIPEPPKDKQ